MLQATGNITMSQKHTTMYIHPMAGRHFFCIQSSLGASCLISWSAIFIPFRRFVPVFFVFLILNNEQAE